VADIYVGRLGLCRAAFCLTLMGVAGSCFVATASAAGVAQPADNDELVTVRLEPGTSLRGLAEKYLNDPDLWPIILRLNGYDDITQIAAGQDLVLPGSQVRLAAGALDASLTEIQRANEAGAQIFAPVLIKAAIGFRDQAVVESKNGTFQESIALSSKSISSAAEARTTSEGKRDVEAEARLSDRQGWVEGQKVAENSWSERALDAVLNEQEKLRTLSASTAQVVFRDASRLRLNPNSQAVIQRMRDDPLRRKKEAQISLVEGDFYALLAPDSDRSKLEVKMAGVDASVESGNFWVSQDAAGAKFSNFDVKPVAIVSGGDTLVLGRNEGAVVRPGAAPDDKVDVIGRVALRTPADNAVIFGRAVQLGWEEIEGGRAYWVEVAYDPRFDRMVESRSDLPGNSTGDMPLAPGTYFWRVAALDEFGLPGQMSSVRKFEIIADDTPPFLQPRTPEPNAVVREAAVTVSGETEAGAAVFVNGEVADVDRNGRFFLTLNAAEGANEVALLARDSAGNITTRSLSFTYIRDAAREVVYDAHIPRDQSGRFLSAGSPLSLSGVVTPAALVSVLDGQGAERAQAYADGQGHFTLNLPLAAKEQSFTLRVTTASGYAYEETIAAAIVDQSPRFRLSEPLPMATSQAALDLAIVPEAGTILTVNGSPIQAGGGVARYRLDLKPGANVVEIVGANAVGLVTVEKHTVVFDPDKPEMTERQVSVEENGDFETLSFRIGARDASGLALTSRLRLSAAGREQVEILRYNKAQRAYVGTAEIPRRVAGERLAMTVELADLAGNVRNVEFTE
jgi:hypothetical protein